MRKEGTSKRRSLRRSAFFIGISLALALIAVLPADFIDHLPAICLWRHLGFSHCWGCGMTRAFWHLLHGEFKTALDWNWRILIVAPILAGLYFRLGYQALTGNPLTLKFLQKKIF